MSTVHRARGNSPMTTAY